MKDDKTPRKTNTKQKGFITEDGVLQREENGEMLKKMQEKAKEMSEKQKEHATDIENNREGKTLDYLNAIYQNARVGMQSIKDILPSIEEEELIDEVNRQYVDYGSICLRCEHFASRTGLNIKDNNFMEKAKMWTSIKMATLMDKTTRHIAEMLILGTVMGLTTCYKDMFDYKNVNYELNDIIADLEIVQEKNYTRLKEFLRAYQG